MMGKVKLTKDQAKAVERKKLFDGRNMLVILRDIYDNEDAPNNNRSVNNILRELGEDDFLSAYYSGYEVIEDRKREKDDVFKGDILWFNESVQEVVKVNDEYVYLDVIGKVTREIVRLTLEKNQTCFICYVEDRLDNVQ